ncbi:MAG: bacillithiol biosynthesis deacetylase BshB1 [Ignavibacteriae bacterium]|nr:bacillithiol biosynthesis deacetylase BshB1 [Ignavibacteriota bacterium]
MTEKLDVLFFGAHPDDVELTCGGTAAKLVKAGKKIGIIDLTKAELSSRGNPELREKEAAAATEILGASIRENLALSDGNITNDPDSRLKVISAIRKYKPALVFAPYPGDRHPDHIHASELIREAAFYAGLAKIADGNDPHRPLKVYYYPQAYGIPVSFVFDISDTFDKKMQAIKSYGSQFFNPGYKQNEPATLISSELFYKEIEARARHCGFKIGVEFGEPFFSYESVKADAETIFEI